MSKLADTFSAKRCPFPFSALLVNPLGDRLISHEADDWSFIPRTNILIIASRFLLGGILKRPIRSFKDTRTNQRLKIRSF